MIDAEYIVGLIIVGLAIIAWHMIRNWKKTWEDTIIAHDQRLDIHSIKHGEQDVVNAKIETHLDHIKETSDRTAKDVKELLKQNGRRSTA